MIKGIGNHQWKPEPVGLANRKIGIIGLGATGRMLANLLQAFWAEVFYFSRNRKPDAELAGIKYLSLDELLMTTEIISLHLPKKTNILKNDEFKKFGNGKILINTSLGLTFAKYNNVLSTNVVSGWFISVSTPFFYEPLIMLAFYFCGILLFMYLILPVFCNYCPKYSSQMAVI